MDDTENLRNQLKALAPTLGQAQRKVARVMLEDFEEVAFVPAGDLAERAGVHTATVVRLAQRLGYEGYPKLQRALRATRSTYPRFLQKLENTRESNVDGALTSTVIAQTQQNLKQLPRTAPATLIRQVAETLVGARRVLVLGIGVAVPVAVHLSSSLQILGIASNQPVDPVSISQQLGLLDPEDVVVVIDFHRYYQTMVEAATAAAEAGATVVALTDSEVSPLTALSQFSLIAPSDTRAPRSSLASAMVLIEILVSFTVQAELPRAERSMRRIDDSYNEQGIFN